MNTFYIFIFLVLCLIIAAVVSMNVFAYLLVGFIGGSIIALILLLN